ncbi:hypothetical protein OAP63_17105 [Vibrio sp.]|uniref:Uncharacterized protein n=1 Tax=Vibrio viridaestus TaxID=2487322 RepID=A0A3N9TH04_9VIBR|nr:hypothetical protein [Vibrio viridaestus]MDC0612451.1 hypothetical protein [Vibrio sp.]RQW62755.1 hypothetical protein EES38_13600 [Vibrio viridaestus]
MNDYYIDNGEKAVRELLADLLEKFNKQIQEGKSPKTRIQYFGATLEVKLLSFEGVGNFQKEPS